MMQFPNGFVIILLFVLTASQDFEQVPYSLIAPGLKCSNNIKTLSTSLESAQDCATMVCADPQCGPMFEDSSHSRQGLSCSCMEVGQTCDEVSDPGTNRYQITDTKMCASSASADCFVQLFENGDFTGWAASFTPGIFAGSDFEAQGAQLKSVSSAFVGQECVATLFQNSDFTGWSVSLTEGGYAVEDFVAQGAVDDDTSAILVRHKDSPDPFASRGNRAQAGGNRQPVYTGQANMHQPQRPTGSFSFSPPPQRCEISVAKDLTDWPCDLVSKEGCTEEELGFLASAEKLYALEDSGSGSSWKGNLENVEADALKLYFSRNDVKRSARPWVIKRIAILLHLCERGAGQSWGLDKPRKKRDEL